MAKDNNCAQMVQLFLWPSRQRFSRKVLFQFLTFSGNTDQDVSLNVCLEKFTVTFWIETTCAWVTKGYCATPSGSNKLSCLFLFLRISLSCRPTGTLVLFFCVCCSIFSYLLSLSMPVTLDTKNQLVPRDVWTLSYHVTQQKSIIQEGQSAGSFSYIWIERWACLINIPSCVCCQLHTSLWDCYVRVFLCFPSVSQ